MPENLQLYLSIPRLIQIGLSLIICIVINQKYQNITFKERPLVHRLFLSGIFAWFIGTILDFLIYPIAPLSFDPNVPITVIGYDFNYPSLVVANILKDIVFITMYYQIWSFLYATLAIEYGELYARNIMRKPWNYLIYILIGVIIISFENVGVQIQEDIIIVGTIGNTFVSFAKYLLPTFGYTFSAIRMNKTLRNAGKQGMDEKLIQKTQFLSYGVSLLGFSYCFYIVMRTLGLILGLYDNSIGYLIVAFIVHILWISSLVCFYLGLRPDIKIESKLSK